MGRKQPNTITNCIKSYKCQIQNTKQKSNNNKLKRNLSLKKNISIFIIGFLFFFFACCLECLNLSSNFVIMIYWITKAQSMCVNPFALRFFFVSLFQLCISVCRARIWRCNCLTGIDRWGGGGRFQFVLHQIDSGEFRRKPKELNTRIAFDLHTHTLQIIHTYYTKRWLFFFCSNYDANGNKNRMSLVVVVVVGISFSIWIVFVVVVVFLVN